MFDRVLVPVDGSGPATRAAKFGLELAAVYGASVDVLHVVEGGLLRPGAGDAERSERAEAVLDAVTDLDVDGSPPVETHVLEGRPGAVIGRHVREHDVDLVAMGRRARTGIRGHVLGSVADRVLRSVDVPVLTVAGEEVRPETGRTYADVLLTTDGSDVAERAAPVGADVARRTGATLHLLTVVDVMAAAGVFDAGGVDRAYVERLEERGRDAIDRLADSVDDSVAVESALVHGHAASEIGAYADGHGVDLVVMASRGQTGIVGQRLGSTARRVLGTVLRPVLVVPVTD
jgi:nucleotide-binding universal stress UspA family protein